MKISTILILCAILVCSYGFRARTKLQLSTGSFTAHQDCATGHNGPTDCASVDLLLDIPGLASMAFDLCDEDMGNNGDSGDVTYGGNYGCLCCEHCHSTRFTDNSVALPC